jgi:heterodisulfide reductase subunit D
MLNLQRVIDDSGIRLCLDCGKCTVVCPVARYDLDFNPRLIVQGVLLQNGPGSVDEQVWSCVSCNMCMERCNYNVNYTDFIRSLRHKAFIEGAELQYSHGGAPQTIMHIMGQDDLRQNRLNWLTGDIEVHKESDTAFFVGCAPYFDVMFSDLGVKTTEGTKGALKLLNIAQKAFTLIPNERCCGRDLLLLGDVEGFVALAQANIHEFNKRGITNIITSCPECYYTLKVDYARFVGGWNINIMHITEVIDPLIDNGQLVLGRLSRKVTYHDPCTLGRYSRIFDQPRHILAAVDGLEIVEMADTRERAMCCGASPWAYCSAVHKQMQKERLSQARATGAEILVTSCPKCLIHLTCAQTNAENNGVCRIEIRDMFYLISQSLLPQEKNS